MILAGAIFGDNLAPISDTTILSAATQEYKNIPGTADIGGCVATRFKYSLVAAIISIVIYAIIGGGYTPGQGAEALLAGTSPKSLVMLAPVLLALFISVKSRNIFKAVTVGLVLGIVVGLVFGLISWSDIFYVTGGTPGGFLYDGINNMVGVVILIISLFGIMGVMKAAGAFDVIIKAMLSSKLGRTPRGAEFMLAITMTLITIMMGGGQDPAILTMGPIYNKVGQELNIHPYRRANLLDGISNSLPVSVPVISCYVFLTAQLSAGYDFVAPLTAVQVSSGMVYTVMLFLTLMAAIFTGWGRIFEGPNGEPLMANGQEIKNKYSIIH